jgi:hypothetical protein
MNIPKYVKIDNSKDNRVNALRLIGDRYYRDGGDWYVGYRVIDGKLLSWCWGLGLRNLHRQILIEITEEECCISNGIYASKEKVLRTRTQSNPEVYEPEPNQTVE